MRELLLALLCVTALGCDGGDAGAPVHVEVVCVSAVEGRALACSTEVRRQILHRWADEAIHAPGSSFVLWAVTESGAKVVAYATVPERWSGPVMAAKARFIETTQAAVLTSDLPESSPSGASPRPLTTRTEDVVTRYVDANGEVGAPLALRPNGRPLQGLLLCDRSTSTLERVCNHQSGLGLYDGWLKASGGADGSRFGVMVVGTSRDTTRSLELDVRLNTGSAGERVAEALSARMRVKRALSAMEDAGDADTGSAIVEAIDVGAEWFLPSGDRALYLASDLRQVSAGAWNFERRAPRPRLFVRWVEQQRLAVDLHDVHVEVCGVHHRRAPGAGPFNAELAARVHDAWDAVFERMGARAVTMRPLCESATSAPTEDAPS